MPKKDVEKTTQPGALSCTAHKILFGDQIEKSEMVGNVASIGENRLVYSVLVGKSEGKEPLGRTRLRRENNIQKDIQEVGCGVCAGLIWLRMEISVNGL